MRSELRRRSKRRVGQSAPRTLSRGKVAVTDLIVGVMKNSGRAVVRTALPDGARLAKNYERRYRRPRIEIPSSPDPRSSELIGSGIVVGATGDSVADHVDVMFPPAPSNAR